MSYIDIIQDTEQNSYDLHDSRLENGVVEGTTLCLSNSNNSAGCYWFSWKDISDLSGNEFSFIMCESDQETPIDPYGVQPENYLSFEGYPKSLQIVGIDTETSRITVDITSDYDWQTIHAAFQSSVMIWFTSESEFISNDIIGRSVAFGHGNKANREDSLAVGDSNTADGRSSMVAGHNNIVGDYALSIGANNNTFGKGSMTIGDSCTTLGDYSLAVGSNLTTTAEGQLVIGTSLNIPSGTYDYAFMVGASNGNPLMLKRDGTLYVRGNIYANSAGNLSSTNGGVLLNGVTTSASPMYLLGVETRPSSLLQVLPNKANAALYATDGILNAKSITTSNSYIKVGNIRVWVASSAPANAQDGDIGIGW